MIDLLYETEGLPPGTYSHLGAEMEARLICAGLARVASRQAPQLNPLQVGNLTRGVVSDVAGAYPVGSFRTVIESGRLNVGACVITVIKCEVAAGSIIVYDSETASGPVAVAEYDLVLGTALLQEGGRLGAACATDAYVVLSDPAARVILGFR